jgi:hypothetical protein
MFDAVAIDDTYWQETGKTLDELATEIQAVLYYPIIPDPEPTIWDNVEIVFKMNYQQLIENYPAYDAESQAIKDWLLNFINKRRQKLINLNSSETMTEKEFWYKYFIAYGFQWDSWDYEVDLEYIAIDEQDPIVIPDPAPGMAEEIEYYYGFEYEPEWFPDPSEGFLDPVKFLYNDDLYYRCIARPGFYQLNQFLFMLDNEAYSSARNNYFFANVGRTMTELEFFNWYFDPLTLHDYVKIFLFRNDYPIVPYVDNLF